MARQDRSPLDSNWFYFAAAGLLWQQNGTGINSKKDVIIQIQLY